MVAQIKILVPKGCKKTALSVHALDSHSRDLAYDTHIFVGNRRLLCESFKVLDNGNCLVEVRPECFEIQEDVEASTS